jgi:hypothetical protein
MRKQSKQTFASKTASSRARTMVAALATAGATLAIAGAPGAAAMETPHVDGNGNVAVCDFKVHVNLVGHGLTVSEVLSGAQGERTTGFESDRGIASCTGKVNGRWVRGEGAAQMVGSYQASPLCLRGVGSGSITMAMPRVLAFFANGYETLQGDFGLDLSGTDWRQLGSLADESGVTSSFTALSRMTADSGSLCTTRAGVLAGRLVIGGTSSQRSHALQT